MAAIESPTDKAEILFDFLMMRARSSSDARLMIDAVSGFAVGAAAILWRGPGWYAIMAAGICFLCYGGWGIADRELRERADADRATQWLGFARIATAIIGVASMVAFVLFAMAI